ncbi:MAG: hypothetical protein IPG56_02220 [Caulobacteraceae bacterium]|nr:hypothetical protein [Caulobacteraceae bacterium]
MERLTASFGLVAKQRRHDDPATLEGSHAQLHSPRPGRFFARARRGGLRNWYGRRQRSASSGGSAAIGAYGLDLTAGDPSVQPGNDFFRYCNGRWLDTTEIPSDQRSWGTFVILAEKASQDQRVIIEETALAGGAPGSAQQRIAATYNAYLNTDAINARGLAPLQEDLASIAALRTHEDVIRSMARNDIPTNGPIVAFAGLDARNPQRYVVSFTHAGLGLPEREYYRRADGEANRVAYVAYIEQVLTLAGQSNGAAKARSIMALETQIARLHWPVADRRQRDRTYNLKTRAELRAIAPNFPWDAGLEAAGMGEATEVVVRELSAMAPLAQLFLATPVSTWRDYLTYNLISSSAVYSQARSMTRTLPSLAAR